MIDMNKKLKELFDKCEFTLNGEIFSKELLMKEYTDFLNSTLDSETRQIGMVMHTGSICFDAMLVITAAFSCLLNNDYDAEETIASLASGDLVIYGKERYYFVGIEKNDDGDEIIHIENDKKTSFRLPKSMWNKITPYYGNSKKSGGIGIKKNNKITDFYENVLNINANDIPSVIESSAVIVMPKERAEYLFLNLGIIANHRLYKLNELFTASYYSENKDYQIGSNSSKNESVLQFASQLYVAGNRLRDCSGNKKTGIIITGDDTVVYGKSEIPELLQNRKLNYSMLSFNIDVAGSENYPEMFENVRLFPCTKEMLASCGDEAVESNSVTRELAAQRKSVINKTIETKVFDNGFTWKRCSELKRKINNIKNYDLDSEEKKLFVIQSFALLNILLTAPFEMSAMNDMFANNESDIKTVEMRLNDIKGYASGLPDILSEQGNFIINELEVMYNELSDSNPKYDNIKKLLSENRYSKIAVIVPKGYYIGIMKQNGIYDIMDDPDDLLVTTANRFNKHEIYDMIIVVGDFSGTKFDIFRCQSSEKVTVLLYKFEDKYFRYSRKKYDNNIRSLNKLSCVKTDYEEYNPEEVFEDEVEEEAVVEIKEIDNIITEYNNEYIRNDFSFLYSNSHYTGSQETEVVALAIMENDERAFFTKRYRAYVYSDEENKNVREVSVDKLSVGDTVLFTVNNSETADIVDIILRRRIEENKYPEEVVAYYDLSKKWKNGLREYVNKLGLKESTVAKAMIKTGINVEAATILEWLDDGSRIVGPSDAESIKIIGHMIRDSEMEQNYKAHHDACRAIRSVRRKILKEIADVIIYRLSGRVLDKSSDFYDVYERLEAQSELLTIKSLIPVERKLPGNMVNRLINQ